MSRIPTVPPIELLKRVATTIRSQRLDHPGHVRDIVVLGATTTIMMAVLIPTSAFAFAGMPSGSGCTDFINNPQEYRRHREADITYRISNNFKVRYPDEFSQYLVRDVVDLWEAYIGGVTPWNADITDRFSYYRNDPSKNVYELKSVLAHEFGHAIGMQHSDACYYNNNSNTNMPYFSNYRTSGGVFSVEPTIGPEIMNEVPRDSSPGVKASGIVRGYFRTPGRDALEFAGAAYPFQSIDFEEIFLGTPVILFDSTDVAQAGGQTSTNGLTYIVPDNTQQGQYFDAINIWVGNNIGTMSRYESWFVENYTGYDITQISLRLDGTSTSRAISESAPPFFTNFGASRQSSPEEIIFSWSTPNGGPWPPSASGWLTLKPDVHDWSISEALMWHYSNDAFPMAVAYYGAETPWAFATPNSPAPGMAPQYTADPSLPAEDTPFPDNIELIPPPSSVIPGIIRRFTTYLPQPDDAQIESFELLPIDWAEAELLFRISSDKQNAILMTMFADRKSQVRNLLHRSQETHQEDFTLEEADFHADDKTQLATGRNGDQPSRADTFSRRIDVNLPERQTYAVRLVASNKYNRVTSLSMPEHTSYLGTQTARCDIASTADYCCPAEMSSRIELGKISNSEHAVPYSTAHLNQSSCIAGVAGADIVDVIGKTPHFLSLGDGDDKVRVFQSGSVVLLGRGEDSFEADSNAAATVRGGRDSDDIRTSLLDDYVAAGEGDDRVQTFDGNDVIHLDSGNDYVDAGTGNDTIYPGSGRNQVYAGKGDDEVVFLHSCEFEVGASTLYGGEGNDRLVLPTTEVEAHRFGLKFEGFEEIVEHAERASLFADCEQ